jgi:hypothetical protein
MACLRDLLFLLLLPHLRRDWWWRFRLCPCVDALAVQHQPLAGL